MKHRLLFLLTIVFAYTAHSQDTVDSVKTQADTSRKVKKGWSFGVLPAIAFDADLGFQYGGLCNIYHYGDGSRYPAYDHSLYVEVSRMTRGSGINRIFYDGNRLIPNKRLTVDISLLQDKAFNFFGFNGYEAQVNQAWMDTKSVDYHSRMFYAYDRTMLRVAPDIQGKISNHLRWLAGLAMYRFWIQSVQVDALNEGKKAADTLPHVPGLYDQYVAWKIIPEDQKSGGWFNAIKTGVVFDTRDNEPNPNHGVWDEVVMQYVPSFMGNKSDALRMSVTHRQYITIIPKRLTFCYRLAWQGVVAGEVPFYAMSQLLNSFQNGAYSEGIGGAKTLRGVWRYRAIAPQVAYSNTELRYTAWRGIIKKQNIYVNFNAFFDAGACVQRYQFSKLGIDPKIKQELYFNSSEGLHTGVGGGVHFVMNENFIVTAEYGVPLNKQDGAGGLYITLNFLF